MVRVFRLVVACCALVTIAVGAIWAYQAWRSRSQESPAPEEPSVAPSAPDESVPVRLSRQARENLGLISKPLQLTTFWRTIDLPGVIVDRPGVSDRGVVSPVTGVVTKINAVPGDTVEPNSALFSVRLVSESLHASQMELFKATQDIEIAKQQLDRLSEAAQSGALPKSRIIEIENEIKRLDVAVRAYQQDLEARGLPREGIDAAAQGEFVAEVVVRAPNDRPTAPLGSLATDRSEQESGVPFTYEVQSLKVELGQQVESGQLLCDLADHRALFVEGRAFKDDMPLIQLAAKNGWDVEVDFGPQHEFDWSPLPTRLPINHIANTVDPETRTFAFYLPLENQSQSYATADGAARLLWRFRPGGRLRLRVPVEQLENVFVVPGEALVKEGPEAYIFRQNGDLFDRRPVRVLHEDRLYAVLANDGSVSPGFYIAQNSAASLNRVLKAQSASGAPSNVHVHADGTVHGAH
jgi:cobalt-zinc-cadmium efflux system membrane fusion protein